MKSVNSHSEIGWKLINGNEISRENNFDLIRLFAALQVFGSWDKSFTDIRI